VRLPVKDLPVNTIPELNFRPAFNHPFYVVPPVNEEEKAALYIKSDLLTK
jgi:hypothetical protein